MAPHRFVDTEAELAWVVEQLLDQPRYALDTEFHRERTYWPKVALVQIAWPGELVLIDPLAVDLAPLRALMDSDALAVLHAAAQDLEVLELATGAVPRRLFDTQIAAGYLGMSTPSLESRHERELGVQMPKGNRLTDWLERPLKSAQRSTRLPMSSASSRSTMPSSPARPLGTGGVGRGGVRDHAHSGRGPRPIRGVAQDQRGRHLKGGPVDRSLDAAWRERRAAEIDQPVRFVLSDIAVVSVAQSAPDSPEALRRFAASTRASPGRDRGEDPCCGRRGNG